MEKMFAYRIYGLKLISDREFVQFLPEEKALEMDREEGVDNSNLPHIYIKKGVPQKVKDNPPGKWEIGKIEGFLSNKTAWIYVQKGEEICYELRPEGLDEKLNSYLAGFGMAFLALQRGLLPIHSSSLMKDGEAVLISGDSGAGKSTTTAAYIEEGYSLMADDITFVGADDEGNVLAYPGFPYQKLCRNEVEKRHDGEEGLIYIDEDRDKFLVPWRGLYSPNPKPLKGIIFLSLTNEENLIVEDIKGFNKYIILSKCLYMRRLIGEQAYQKAIGEKVMWLASKARLIGVARPREKDTIDELVRSTREKLE